jgi:TPR repeat protein
VAALVARGQTYLANGDIVSARLVFRRAAEAGDAQAALALGGTFDPLVLKSLGVIGVVADSAQARKWYQKAAELGSREAPQRIDQLAQWTR